MGCDGVWEQKSNEEMVKWVYEQLGADPQKADLSKIVSNLLNENLSEDHTMSSKCPQRANLFRRTINLILGLGCDNMTCILIVFRK